MMCLDRKYVLFLDDERTIEMVDRTAWPDGTHILIARSSKEAMDIVESFGDPAFCSFDHDLGGDDTTMGFLKWYTGEYYDPEWSGSFVPSYVVHSANPVGKLNIIAFMESWKRSLAM
jgi:hypothetical protein